MVKSDLLHFSSSDQKAQKFTLKKTNAAELLPCRETSVSSCLIFLRKMRRTNGKSPLSFAETSDRLNPLSSFAKNVQEFTDK